MSSSQKSAAARTDQGAPISVTVAGAVLVLGAILFSCKAILVKLSLPYGIDPVSLLALRMIFAVPAYIAILTFCLRSKQAKHCLLYTSPSPRDQRGSRMPSSA